MTTQRIFNNADDGDQMSAFADLLHQGTCSYKVSFKHHGLETDAMFDVVRSDKTDDEHWDRIRWFHY